MADLVVKSSDSNEELQRKATEALGGPVKITERAPGEKLVRLEQSQADKLNRMSPEDRNEALGGNVRQMLND